MKLLRLTLVSLAFGVCCPLAAAAAAPSDDSGQWVTMEDTCTARHEAGGVAVGDKFFLMGGRRENPVEIFDTTTEKWTTGSKPPMEIHHFQPVLLGDKIYALGAMTGRYPHETAIENILIYDPATDQWTVGPEIPEGRRRGGAGVSVYNDKLYIASGIVNGHWDGHVKWFDVFDPATGEWEQLPDAPRARDHFQTVVMDDKLYLAGGRRSSAKTKQTFDLVVGEVDVYDFKTGEWTTLPEAGNLPTLRAGCMAVPYDGEVLVIGGEHKHGPAHDEVEALDPETGEWRLMSRLQRGRHGGGVGVIGENIYVASGSGNRGGGPELNTIEKFVPSR